MWAKNGRELYYVDPVHALMAVPVETSGSTFTFGNRSKLFEISPQAPYAARDYDVAKDGRFLMAKTDPTADQQRLTIVVVLNWFEELREKFQGSKVP